MSTVREIAEKIINSQAYTGANAQSYTLAEIKALAAHVLASTEPSGRLSHLRDLKKGWDSYGGESHHR